MGVKLPKNSSRILYLKIFQNFFKKWPNRGITWNLCTNLHFCQILTNIFCKQFWKGVILELIVGCTINSLFFLLFYKVLRSYPYVVKLQSYYYCYKIYIKYRFSFSFGIFSVDLHFKTYIFSIIITYNNKNQSIIILNWLFLRSGSDTLF